jgi:hypothetical protein
VLRVARRLGEPHGEEDFVERDGERYRDDHAVAIPPEVDQHVALRRDEKATPFEGWRWDPAGLP